MYAEQNGDRFAILNNNFDSLPTCTRKKAATPQSLCIAAAYLSVSI